MRSRRAPTRRLGLFEQAAALEAQLDARERAAMEGDRIAQMIRHGRIDANTLRGPARMARLDAALARTDALARGFLDGAAVDAEGARLLADRLSALAARDRPAEVVRLYEAMRTRAVAVPDWALGEVAGAYLALRRPREAEALYRAALKASPDDFDANLGLFYALVETEQLDAAAAHIDAYAARTPLRRHRDGQVNGERTSADIAGDQARLYADRIDAAQQRIAQRIAALPGNGEARAAEASLHLSRGWTRRGEEDLRRNLGRDPQNPALHADRAETLLALQRWEEARAELATAQALDPDNAGVRRAGESFALHERRELYVDSGYGQGKPGDPFGSRDWRVDAYLYSSPLGENWRVFLHRFDALADYNGSNTKWIRSGAGAEWRRGDWRATVEANGGNGEKNGGAATLRWQIDDQWRVYGAAESMTNDVPLQAVRAGITANRGNLGVDWRLNESRKFALAATQLEFSDGNRRQVANSSWFERWLSTPRWTLETTLGIDATQNSLGYSAAYFNPPNDHSLWASGSVENLTWRNYDRSFRQRLTLSAGEYWQSGFGGGSIRAAEYQHRWELDRDLSLRYAVGRSLRPYDGVQEPRNFATLTVLWRF